MVVMYSSNGRRSRPNESKGVCAMLRQTMIVLATAAALTTGLTADAFARGGGGHGGGFGGGAHIGGGFGGAHIGGAHLGGFGGGARVGGFGGARMGGLGVGTRVGGGFGRDHFGGGTAAFARGVAGQHFAQARGPLRHERNFDRRRRFVPGFGFGFDDYDYGCGYGYAYYTPDSCYPLAYPSAF